MLVRWQSIGIPAVLRYGMGGCALVLAAIGVGQAMRVPPLKDVEIEIANLPPQFEDYRMLQLTDPHISRLFDAPWTRAVVKQSNELAPADVPVVLLDHQPRKARLAAAQGVGLQLSGHTHGGLIAGFDRLFALANEGFVSGLYEVQGMQLCVNNGTALWPGLALRLVRPSESTRITLTRKRS